MTPNSYRIFLYGPLTDARVLSSILGREVATSEAVLPGYRKFTEKEGENSYPTVEPDVEDPSKTVKGKTFHATTQDIYTLDAWHGPYSRFLALLGDHQQAWVYYYTAVAARPEQGFVKTASADAAQRSRTGPDGIAAALAEVDMDALEQSAFEALQSGKKTARPEAIKKLKILQGLRKNKLHPKDMVWDSLPVVPPAFRPYAVMGDMLLAGDVNELYQDTISMADAYRELEQVAGKDSQALNEFKPQLYGAVRASTGFGKPVSTKGQERDLKGFMAKVLGSGPKYAYTTRKLLSKPQDFVGRAVIGVDPDLTIDEVGIPDDMAWSLFELPGQRRMVKDGVPVAQAVTEWAERSDRARKARDAEVAERPVLYSRAPVWHQQGILAGMAKIVDGDQMMVNPVTTTGLGADFDGDAQIGKVLVLRDLRNKLPNLSESEKYSFQDLTLHDAEGNLLPMYRNLCIPSFDPSYQAVSLVDLEDFPRGEFSNTNPSGANGPIHFFDAIPGTKVIALDEKTGDPVWADVVFVSEHPGRAIEVVTLSNKKQIITDDDPRAVYGVAPAGDFEFNRFTPSQALAAGVCVPVVRDTRRLIGDGDLTALNLTKDTGCAFSSLPLNFDFGYFCGALAGDGWWDKRDHDYYLKRGWKGLRCLHLADLKGCVATYLENWLHSIPVGDIQQYRQEFNKVDYPDRYGDTVRYTWNFKHSDVMARWLDMYLGGSGDEKTAGSGNKKLPDFLHRTPEEFRIGLLTGIMDTDGSVSISNGKTNPQMMASVGSTSLRLLRDIQWLGSTLGARGTISFSKETTRGNTAWILTWSAADLKRNNLLGRLQTPSKKEAYDSGNPSDELGSALISNKVVLPCAVCDDIKRSIQSPKITKEMRAAGGPELVGKKRQQNLALQLWEAKKVNLISRPAARKLLAEMESIYASAQVEYKKSVEHLRSLLDTRKPAEGFSREYIELHRRVIRTCAPVMGDPGLYKLGQKEYGRFNVPNKTGKMSVFNMEQALKFLVKNPPKSPFTPAIAVWRKWVEDESIVWARVEKVEKTGQKETGYDLTVPGYETFMSIDGVILSNTMNTHALLTPEAVKDAKEKLFPSKQLFSIRDQRRTLPEPKQDIVLGLYSSQANPSRNRHTYGDAETAMRDLRTGKAAWSDTIEIPDGVIAGV